MKNIQLHREPNPLMSQCDDRGKNDFYYRERTFCDFLKHFK